MPNTTLTPSLLALSLHSSSAITHCSPWPWPYLDLKLLICKRRVPRTSPLPQLGLQSHLHQRPQAVSMKTASSLCHPQCRSTLQHGSSPSLSFFCFSSPIPSLLFSLSTLSSLPIPLFLPLCILPHPLSFFVSNSPPFPSGYFRGGVTYLMPML